MAAAVNAANNTGLQPDSPIFNINAKLTELADIKFRYSISKIYNIRPVSRNNQLNSPRNVFRKVEENSEIEKIRNGGKYLGKISTTNSLCNLTQQELATQLSRINIEPGITVVSFLDKGWPFFYIETNNAMYIAYTDEKYLKKYKSTASCTILGGRHKYKKHRKTQTKRKRSTCAHTQRSK